MNLFLTMRRVTSCCCLFMWILLVLAGPAFSSDNHVADKDKRVSFEFRDQSMAEVAGIISEQLNYKVLMDDELVELLISGKFNNVTLDEFFARRIFRGKNVAILFDDNEHVVIINSLGKKSRLTEYDRTNHANGLANIDPLDIEAHPGVKRRDVVMVENDIDPLDIEVHPGVKRRDVVMVENDIDPLDIEVHPGVKRRDVVMVENDIDPLDIEVHPGVKRRDVVYSHLQ